MAASKFWKHKVAEKLSSFLLKTLFKMSVQGNFSRCYVNRSLLIGVFYANKPNGFIFRAGFWGCAILKIWALEA
jgi:hypothetical protein